MSDHAPQRADKFLVMQGYFDTRAQAQAAIKAGKVKVNGQRLKKSSQILSETDMIDAKKLHPWVSRGGLKLAHALKIFDFNPSGLVCLDVGASTGGFTDVLIAQGAAKVYAVDVGHDQLHQKLINHPQIISMEGQDARALSREMFDPLPRLIVCDTSFISATKVLDKVLDMVTTGSHLITLVKPQFEVGKDGIGRGGLVRNNTLRDQALSDVTAWIGAKGWQVIATTSSPIKGGSGNHEFLLFAAK